ncbi:hypothetical protein O1W68_19785 [Rhodococcus sp. H36-A4]|uniref:hypothetical protein n=1 Tax=Rhodococcus sp. H36-A4 TaxID=3004353 RepID=UPI0022AFBEA1|nr:hypothetical protein [Rhodococcus sp. H36-A4]MCZ4080191.1 hypothetical protein [Rhodococcus sp. H36-A4]
MNQWTHLTLARRDGLNTDVPGLLEQIGLPVPDGDSDKLTIAADAWRAFAEHAVTTAAARDIRGAVDRFDGLDAPDVAAVTAHLETLSRSAAELISTASALASPVAAHNVAVTDLRTGIKASSDELAWTLGAIGAVTAVAAIATVLLTGGLGALGPAQAEVAAGAAGTTAAIATAANAIRGLLTASTLAALLGSATATFAAINGVTTVSALEVITTLVVQHLPGDDANAVQPYTSPISGNPEYEARREELAKDPAKGGQSNPQSEREADVGLEAESAGVIPGPIIRAPLSEDGKDQGEFVDAAGEHWDVKSSPDLQPSYRPDSGKPIEPSQSDTEFDRMINKQLNKGTGVLLDSDGMTAARESHLRDLVSQRPDWAGKVRWSS